MPTYHASTPPRTSSIEIERDTPTRIQGQTPSIMETETPALAPKGQFLSTTKGLGMSGRRTKGGLDRGGSLERGRQKEGVDKSEKKRGRGYSLSLERKRSSDQETVRDRERERERVRGKEREKEIDDEVHVRSLKDMVRKVQQLEGELSGKGSNQINKVGITIGTKNIPEKEVYLLTDLRTRVLEVERVMTDNHSHLKDLWDSERTNLLNAVQHSKSQIENMKLIHDGAILAVRSRYQNMLDQAQEALEIQTAAAREQIDRLEEMLRKTQLQIQLSKINPIGDVKISGDRREKEKLRGQNEDEGSVRDNKSDNDQDAARTDRTGSRPVPDKKKNENLISKEETKKKSNRRKGNNINLDEYALLSSLKIKNVDGTPQTLSLFSSSSDNSSSSSASVSPSLSMAQSKEISAMRRLVVQTELELESAKICEREIETASIIEIEKMKSELSLQNEFHHKVVVELEKRVLDLQTEIFMLKNNTERMILYSNEKERTYVDVQNDMRDGVYNSGGELGRRRRDEEEGDRKNIEEVEQERRRNHEEDREKEREKEKEKEREREREREREKKREEEREKRRDEEEMYQRKKNDIEKQKNFELTVALKEAEDKILNSERKYEMKCFEMEEMIR